MSNYQVISAAAVSFICAVSMGVGPDVIVGDLPVIQNWGSTGTISAFSIATTSCNIGDRPLSWVESTPAHPVIGQNLFRLASGRFQQIGMSWVKHGFTALAQDLCGDCMNPGTESLLGVGCSDPYGASLNGRQLGLGPRSEVNASTGTFLFPFGNPPIARDEAVLARRIRVNNDMLMPELNAGALYFVEAQYITHDDTIAGNGLNNVSYRQVFVEAAEGSPRLRLRGSDPTERMHAAIEAWQAHDPQVQLFSIDVPNDGRFILGLRSVTNQQQQLHCEVALYNQTSDRSVSSLTLTLPARSIATDCGFSDIHHHSGEPFDGTDWVAEVIPGEVTWTIPNRVAAGPNTNALRWGTVYNFWFDTPEAPLTAELGLFKSGQPSSVSVTFESRPALLAQERDASWLSAPESVDVGTIVRGSPRRSDPHLKVHCVADPEQQLSAIRLSRSGLDVHINKTKENGLTAWDMEIIADQSAALGYFESILTLQSLDDPKQSIDIRLFGVIADK